MATMKAYTDLESSKKLAKILPLESADMYYNEEQDEIYLKDIIDTKYPMLLREGQKHHLEEYGIPCWSLAALLDVLPVYIRHYDYGTYKIYNLNLYKAYYCNVSYTFGPSTNENDDTLYCFGHDNFVDACVKMIEKLHEQNLL